MDSKNVNCAIVRGYVSNSGVLVQTADAQIRRSCEPNCELNRYVIRWWVRKERIRRRLQLPTATAERRVHQVPYQLDNTLVAHIRPTVTDDAGVKSRQRCYNVVSYSGARPAACSWSAIINTTSSSCPS